MAFLSVNGVIAMLYLGAVVARRRALVTAPRLELRGVGHAYGGRVVLAGVELRARARPRRSACSARTAAASRRCCAASRGCCARAPGTCWSTARRAASCRPRRARASPTPATGPLLWGGLSARENLAALRGPLRPRAPRRAERALAAAGLAEAAERPAAALSQGQRQRLALARALLPAARPARAGRAAQRPRRGQRALRLDALLAEARGNVTLVLATHERVARRAALRRAAAARGAAVSAHAVPFVRAVGLLVRTDLVLERRAPQLALAMGAVRRGRAGRAALRRRHPAAAGRRDASARSGSTLLLATLLARRARLQRRARRGPARRARARADPAHRDLGLQGDRDRRAAGAHGGRRGAALVPLPAGATPRCRSLGTLLARADRRATSGSPRSARSSRRSPPRCAVARSWCRCSSCPRPCRC